MAAATTGERREREIAVADARCTRDSALAATGADTERRIIRAAARGPRRDAVTGYTLAVNRAVPDARRKSLTSPGRGASCASPRVPRGRDRRRRIRW